MRLALLLLVAIGMSAGEWVAVEAVATAYCPCAVCCGRRTETTADGTRTTEWPYGIAADPAHLPYGTPVIVPAGQGYLDAQSPDARLLYVDDTGAIVRRRTRATGRLHLDLRYRQHASAQRFGVRIITILVWRS